MVAKFPTPLMKVSKLEKNEAILFYSFCILCTCNWFQVYIREYKQLKSIPLTFKDLEKPTR